MGLALTYPYRKASQDFVSSTAMSSNSIKIAEWKFGGPVTIKCVRASDLQHQKMPVKRPNADVDIRQLRSQLHGKDGVMWIPDAGLIHVGPRGQHHSPTTYASKYLASVRDR